MKIVGYGDKLSVEPGDAITFMISSELPSFDGRIVRLISGDPHPDGPGMKYRHVPSDVEGVYDGLLQHLHRGSYIRVAHHEHLNFAASFTIHLWVLPTLPDKDRQALISKRAANGDGYTLCLVDGRVSFEAGGMTVSLSEPLQNRRWYSVAVVYDHAARALRLIAKARDVTADETDEDTVVSAELSGAATSTTSDLMIAAERFEDAENPRVTNVYNGKADSPRIFQRALADRELIALRGGEHLSEGLVAAWDFSADISSSAITDTSGNGLHGQAVNKPMRAATGWNWDGSETAWCHAPHQYGAIHFHDDDLDDAQWSPSVTWAVPNDQPSGIYALHARADGDAEDYIPFVVRPKRGKPTASIALLLPTFSYLAYGNEHLLEDGDEFKETLGITGAAAQAYPSQPQDKYVLANRLNSLYDTHTDGSGVCYSSRLRPIVNMRPGYHMSQLDGGEGCAHQFVADLHLVDWLDHLGYVVDVITDEDLHAEGVELLEPYSVVLTGTHSEYWSRQMIDGTQEYLQAGGRLMYLAGNGMYWVTQHDPENGYGIEVRRPGPSTRAWEPEPGESHLSATGELGGLWRFRGQSPQSWLGVGMTAVGHHRGRAYARRPDSFSDTGSWVFDGIGDDELIGDFPCLVGSYGAAGFEIDRLDHALGSPYRTLLLASATGFSDDYQHVSEEVFMSDSRQGGTINPLVRADMVLLNYPNGGAVFSPGSIAWCGCLSHNAYENTVSRVTRNVLDRFSAGAGTA